MWNPPITKKYHFNQQILIDLYLAVAANLHVVMAPSKAAIMRPWSVLWNQVLITMIQSARSEPHLWSAFSHIGHLPSHLQWAQEWGRCPWWTNSWLWGENTKRTEDSSSFKWPDSKLVASLYCYQVTKQMKSRRSNKVVLCYSSIEDEYEQVFCVMPLMMNTNLK